MKMSFFTLREAVPGSLRETRVLSYGHSQQLGMRYRDLFHGAMPTQNKRRPIMRRLGIGL